jgi:anti-sigma factor RsiW
MTELSDELLVAYVDGQLDREQARAIDRVLEQDEVVGNRLEALREAHGRLESAFEAILAGELTEIRAHIPAAAPPPAARSQGGDLVKIGLATAGLGLILAALVAGWPIALPDFTGLGRNLPEAGAQAAAGPPTWQERALGAQALLSRASVEIGAESQGNRDLVAFQLGEAIGPALKFPTLEAQGYKFVRGQLLRFGDQPLAQMLYLGAPTKPPLALYAMAGATGDTKPTLKREGAVGSVAWKDGGIAYLLAGEEENATLLVLAAAIESEPSLSDSPVKSGTAPGADTVVTGSTPAKPAPAPAAGD